MDNRKLKPISTIYNVNPSVVKILVWHCSPGRIKGEGISLCKMAEIPRSTTQKVNFAISLPPSSGKPYLRARFVLEGLHHNQEPNAPWECECVCVCVCVCVCRESEGIKEGGGEVSKSAGSHVAGVRNLGRVDRRASHTHTHMLKGSLTRPRLVAIRHTTL